MDSFFLILAGLSISEIAMILIVGLLLFGRRLPEVGRSLGKTFVKFKAGLQDMQSELHEVDRLATDRERRRPEVRPVDAVARGADELDDDHEDDERDPASAERVDPEGEVEEPEGETGTKEAAEGASTASPDDPDRPDRD